MGVHDVASYCWGEEQGEGEVDSMHSSPIEGPPPLDAVIQGICKQVGLLCLQNSEGIHEEIKEILPEGWNWVGGQEGRAAVAWDKSRYDLAEGFLGSFFTIVDLVQCKEGGERAKAKTIRVASAYLPQAPLSFALCCSSQGRLGYEVMEGLAEKMEEMLSEKVPSVEIVGMNANITPEVSAHLFKEQPLSGGKGTLEIFEAKGFARCEGSGGGTRLFSDEQRKKEVSYVWVRPPKTSFPSPLGKKMSLKQQVVERCCEEQLRQCGPHDPIRVKVKVERWWPKLSTLNSNR